jgi:hypothetical protein
MRRIPSYTFAVLLGVLIAGTLLAEALLIHTGRGDLSLEVIVAAGVLGILGVAVLARPEPTANVTAAPPTSVPPAPTPDEAEPFDDPVEAADREDTAAAHAVTPEPDPPDDGLE